MFNYTIPTAIIGILCLWWDHKPLQNGQRFMIPSQIFLTIEFHIAVLWIYFTFDHLDMCYTDITAGVYLKWISLYLGLCYPDNPVLGMYHLLYSLLLIANLFTHFVLLYNKCQTIDQLLLINILYILLITWALR